MTTTVAESTESVYSLTETKNLIDNHLEEYFKVQKVQALTVGSSYVRLWEAAEKLTLSGGKRLRPYMVLLAYRAFADDNIAKIAPAAVASELKHIAMLIHDDIIDRDDIRYSTANVSGQYMAEYADLSPDDQRHFANSTAMLIGDALLSESHRLVSTASDDLSRLRNAQSAFAAAVVQAIGGELIDTESAIRTDKGVNAIAIARHKTASYSFTGPLSVGAHLAGADEGSVEILKRFADSLGIAFQLKDDLLGTFGDSETTGKSNDGDLKEGKRTYLIEKFEEFSDEGSMLRFYNIFGNPSMTPTQADQLRNMLVESGAVDETENIVNQYVEIAKAALYELNLRAEHTREFLNLISICTDRDK